MASGLMALQDLRKRPPCSMLVLRVEAEFSKKADQKMVFTCTEGALIRQAIDQTFERWQNYLYWLLLCHTLAIAIDSENSDKSIIGR